MSSELKIKNLGNFRIWEPVILVPYVSESGMYLIHYKGPESGGQLEQSLVEADILLFANTNRLHGTLTFTITRPNGELFTDADGYNQFLAHIE